MNILTSVFVLEDFINEYFFIIFIPLFKNWLFLILRQTLMCFQEAFTTVSFLM